jgi:formylglycine-generating enzyme required for sulfatase activity
MSPKKMTRTSLMRTTVTIGLGLWCAAGLAARPEQAPATAAYTETIPGTSVTFDMVAVPGGTFVMGSPANEPGRADAGILGL